MTRVFLLLLAGAVAACAPTAGSDVDERSDFRVMEGGIDMDARAIACAEDPQSVGFETSQACFEDALAIMNGA